MITDPLGQDGTENVEHVESVLMMSDDSIIMSGYTSGSFSGANLGDMDFAAWKLDANSIEVWRWQASGETNPSPGYLCCMTPVIRPFQGGCTELVEWLRHLFLLHAYRTSLCSWARE